MRPTLLALGLLLCGPAPALAADPHPETELMTALDDLHSGRMEEAWQALGRLVQRQPNFRLAQLFYGELAAARGGEAGGKLTAVAAADADLLGLQEEARLRLKQWQQGVPAGALPDAVLQLSAAHPYALLVDLQQARLYLLQNQLDTGRGGLRVAQNYYASIGKAGPGKQTTGDSRTPVGVYTIQSHIPDSVLPELYGAGAFPVNYPNAWDLRRRRTGSGIWLHGVPRETFNRAPRSSEGCVTLANGDLMALQPHFLLGQTPVVLSDSVAWLPAAEIARQRQQFLDHLERWRAAWSARDTERYLSYYADDFETDGMAKPAFAAHKRRVNAAKAFIDVKLSEVDVFRYPGEPLILTRFIQHYHSNNHSRTSRKEQYWRIEPDGSYRIVKEAS